MTRADYSKGRPRLGAALAVALLHVALVLALIRAFAPEFGERVAGQALGAFTVTVTASPKPPSASTSLPRTAERAGAAAEAGPRSEAMPLAAPSARIVLATQPAARFPGEGGAAISGASTLGVGTAASGSGRGTGSGSAGSGPGGGGAAKAVKIAGDINSARDYPKATREQRLGDYVIVALTVGLDGRVKDCRVHRPSRDAQSDQITCRLATDRFRFRPASDASGHPVESVYGWQQRWFDPREKNPSALEPSAKSGI